MRNYRFKWIGYICHVDFIILFHLWFSVLCHGSFARIHFRFLLSILRFIVLVFLGLLRSICKCQSLRFFFYLSISSTILYFYSIFLTHIVSRLYKWRHFEILSLLLLSTLFRIFFHYMSTFDVLNLMTFVSLSVGFFFNSFFSIAHNPETYCLKQFSIKQW